MEAIRDIQTVKNGEVHLQLPREFWGRDVEIIVLPAPQAGERSPLTKKSLRGCLKSYANPALVTQEQEAWALAAKDEQES